MNGKKSIKKAVFILFIIITLGIYGLALLTTDILYVNSNRNDIQNILKTEAERESVILSYRIDSTANNASNVAELFSYAKRYDEISAVNVMYSKLKKDKMLFGMGVWLRPFFKDSSTKYYGPYFYKDNNGSIKRTMDYSTSEYNYFTKDWYYLPFKRGEGKMVYSGVYYDKLMETYFVTGSSLIQINNTASGVVSADISIRELIRYTSMIKVGSRGYAFLMSSSGMLLANKEQKPQINNEVLSILSNTLKKGTRSGVVNLRRAEQLAVVSPVGNTGIELVLMYPKAELYAPLYKNMLIYFCVSLLGGAMFLYIMNAVMRRYINDPLDIIMKKIERIMRGNLIKDDSLEGVIKGNNEFSVLAVTVNSMSQELDSMIRSLSEQNLELKESREEIRKSEERYRLIFEASNEGLWDIDLVNNTRYFSDKWHGLFDRVMPKEDMDNLTKWFEQIHPEDYKDVAGKFKDILNGKVDWLNVEYRISTKEEGYIWLMTRAITLKDAEGKPIRIAGSHTDITAKKLDEERIKHLAYYDSLTGLPNRIHFKELAESHICFKHNECSRFAVFFMDIDSFKLINDTYGHTVGDMVLFEVSQRFKLLLDQRGHLSRFGGDEFILLIEDFVSKDYLDDLSEEIHHAMAEPLYADGHVYYLNMSMGISVYPDDGVTVDELLKNADTALFKAKEEGKGRSVFFCKEMNSSVINKTNIESKLRIALKNKELEMYYQPVVMADDGRVAGFEALIRWFHPDGGSTPPSDFIGIAEESKLIMPVGEFVLKSACSFARMVMESGHKEVFVAVNVSVVQLMEKGYSDFILETIEAAGIPYECIEIEITESRLMESFERCNTNINELRKKGVGISIDDFGTGYSSLNYLKQLPITKIKIDKSFIDDIDEKENISFAELIILMSHTLKLKTVAEGIENQRQLEILRKYECDYIQGYYMGKPMPKDEALKLITEK